MQIYQIMGQYQSDRPRGNDFTSHVWTENHVYSDRLAAELTVDLLNIMLDDKHDCHEVWNLGMHGDDEVQSFYVEEFTA